MKTVHPIRVRLALSQLIWSDIDARSGEIEVTSLELGLQNVALCSSG